MSTIDLNADLGEGDAYDAELLRVVSSCNIACGGHAGDADSIAVTMREAIANGVSVGAHPSYPDREGFGRRSGFLSGEPLREALRSQLANFHRVADALGATITHVKPHGALYNRLAWHQEDALIAIRAIQSVDESLAHLFEDDATREAAHVYRKQLGYLPFMKYMQMEPGLVPLLESLRRTALPKAERRSVTVTVRATSTFDSLISPLLSRGARVEIGGLGQLLELFLAVFAETLADLADRRDVEVHLGRPATVMAARSPAVTFAPVPGFRRIGRTVEIAELHPFPWLRRPRGGSVASFSQWLRS